MDVSCYRHRPLSSLPLITFQHVRRNHVTQSENRTSSLLYFKNEELTAHLEAYSVYNTYQINWGNVPKKAEKWKLFMEPALFGFFVSPNLWRYDFFSKHLFYLVIIRPHCRALKNTAMFTEENVRPCKLTSKRYPEWLESRKHLFEISLFSCQHMGNMVRVNSLLMTGYKLATVSSWLHKNGFQRAVSISNSSPLMSACPLLSPVG